MKINIQRESTLHIVKLLTNSKDYNVNRLARYISNALLYWYIYCGDNPNRMICLRWFTTMNQRSFFSWWRPFSLQPIHTQSSAQGAETRPTPGNAGYAHGDPGKRYLGAGGIWSAKMGRKATKIRPRIGHWSRWSSASLAFYKWPRPEKRWTWPAKVYGQRMFVQEEHRIWPARISTYLW